MESYKTVVALATKILDAEEKMSTRFTKAESKRQRAYINQIKKLAVEAKRDLLAKDANV